MVAALHNRKFVLYLCAAACADGGYWISAIAQGWLILKLTNSPFWLGAVAAAGQLPFLLFSLAGGDIADRFDRRAVIALNNIAIAFVALVTAGLVAAGGITVWWLVILGFIAGTITALEHPVDRAWLYDLVEGKALGSSIALSSLEWSVARTFGPAAGGAAVAFIGVAAGYVAYAALVIPIALLAIVLRARRSGGESQEPSTSGAGNMHAITVFSFFIATFTIGVTPYITLLPELARNGFGLDARGYGLMAAAGGIGAIGGAIVLALAGDLRSKGRIVPIASFIGAALLFAFTRVHAVLPAVMLLVLMGAVDTLMYALANTYVQEIAGDGTRGRANAIFSLAFLGGIPIGALALGALAARIGTDAALAWSASAVCIAAVLFWFAAPQAREAA
ncbi:MAG: MFS transporter [Candidatus Velthaea sp.]